MINGNGIVVEQIKGQKSQTMYHNQKIQDKQPDFLPSYFLL